MSYIVTFGEIMGRIEAEHHYKLRQILPGHVKITFAGAEANVASSLSYMGRDTQFVTSLPDNPVAEACLAYLRSMRVGTSFVQSTGDSGRLGLYFLESGANQRPSNVTYDRDFTSISIQDPEQYPWDVIFSSASWFHFSGITPAISEKAARTALMALKSAKQHQVTVSCDLNYRKKLWNWGTGAKKQALARKIMQELLQYVDIIIGNEEDASDVLDIHPADIDIHAGTLRTESYQAVARKAVDKFPSVTHVAFTLRESISATHNNWGAMIYSATEEKTLFSPGNQGTYSPYEIRNIIDRVGGGDSFSAGLIYALTDSEISKNLQDVIDYATAASCLCHSIHGDINYSTPEEIHRLKSGNASGRVIR